MRVVFASTHGAGHFEPLVPFVHAFQEQGHEVLVVGPSDLDAGGFPFRAGAAPPDEELRPLWGRMPALPPGQSDVVVIASIFARLNVRAMLPTLEETIDGWRPDLVVRETAEYASAVAAERHGAPHVRVATGLALTEELALGFAAPALDELAPGLAGRIAASPYPTCFPTSIDATSFPVSRCRDPDVESEPAPLPDWWPGDERPLVYVTFGTAAAALPPAAAAHTHAIEAVAGLPVRVLVTLGGDVDVGPLPPDVHAERWVAQRDVLPLAAAVVCHGGSGTTRGALAAGVPLVFVPLFADQPFNAARVAAAGAGIVSTFEAIGGALERVLSEASFAASARALAAEMRALPPVHDFAHSV